MVVIVHVMKIVIKLFAVHSKPDFPAQTFSYKLLDVTPAWGKSYFTMIILNDHDYFVQTTHSINYEMIGETYKIKIYFKVQVLIAQRVIIH